MGLFSLNADNWSVGPRTLRRILSHRSSGSRDRALSRRAWFQLPSNRCYRTLVGIGGRAPFHGWRILLLPCDIDWRAFLSLRRSYLPAGSQNPEGFLGVAYGQCVPWLTRTLDPRGERKRYGRARRLLAFIVACVEDLAFRS